MSEQAILNKSTQKNKFGKVFNDKNETSIYSIRNYENTEQIINNKNRALSPPPEKVIIKDLLTNRVYNSWYSLLHSEEKESAVKSLLTSPPSPNITPTHTSIPMNTPIFLPNQNKSIFNIRDPITNNTYTNWTDWLLADDTQPLEIIEENKCNPFPEFNF